jgi:hypothetical protein
VMHVASRMTTIFQFLIIDFSSIPILLTHVPAIHPIARLLRTMSDSWKYALDGETLVIPAGPKPAETIGFTEVSI